METFLSKQTNQLIQKSHEIKHQHSQTRYGNWKIKHKQDDVILDWQDLVIARVHPAHSLNAEMLSFDVPRTPNKL